MALAEQREERDTGNGSMSGSRERRCIVTGEVLPQARLLRFVLAPDGQVVPDVEAKLPGRGLWVSADRTIIAQAVTKRLFARAAKAPAVKRARVSAGSFSSMAEWHPCWMPATTL